MFSYYYDYYGERRRGSKSKEFEAELATFHFDLDPEEKWEYRLDIRAQRREWYEMNQQAAY